ncbi:arylsulfatase J-like isoform X2 [Antedon mediterranea]|uniref:arylsulfatase J-like isoform X2 n=1 Tax=Antedon mediterranea TaxID=105859 RepID=UPI003AF5E179
MAPLSPVSCFVFICMFILVSVNASTTPNIIFILADDYGYNDIGYHGSEIQTPNLDRLAKSGVRFENYYVQPICTPTRSQLLSGRYQIYTGLQHSIIWPTQPNCLPVSMTTLPQRLKDNGYATHAVGKWHIGFYKKECLPTSRGFDSFFGYLTGSEDYWTHYRNGGFPSTFMKHWYAYDLHDDLRPAWEYTGNYSTYIFTEQVQNIITKHNTNEPFFLYLALQSVHSPLQAPDKYINMYSHIKNKNRRLYAAMTTCMDDAVGKIVQSLKDNLVWNNTILIFSTDNGGQVLQGGNNWPLRGWKASYWEGGMKAVGFTSSPLLPLNVQGTITKELMHISDWFPTLVQGIANGNISDLTLDGFNVWPTISENKPSPRKELLHNIDAFEEKDKSVFNVNMTAAIRVGDWKLLTGHPGV